MKEVTAYKVYGILFESKKKAEKYKKEQMDRRKEIKNGGVIIYAYYRYRAYYEEIITDMTLEEVIEKGRSDYDNGESASQAIISEKSKTVYVLRYGTLLDELVDRYSEYKLITLN